eukprot:gene40515-49384_t
MATIKGYRIISLSLSDDFEVFHQVYLKEHMDKKSNGKVLLVGNVDIKPDLTVEQIDKSMRLLFAKFGDIDEVSISDIEIESLSTSRFAHVTFNKKASVKLALNASNADYEEAWLDARKKLGFIAQHNVVKTINQLRRAFLWKREDPEQWQARVDEEMREFEEDEERERREHQEAREKPDDDGFILVASKNKRKREDDHNVHRGKTQRTRKNKKDTELKNFYRFQIKEQKMKQLDILRKKFEEDKEKVAKMKDARKFKPY